MAPTTITTIVLILLAAVCLGMAAYCWLSDWEPRYHRSLSERIRDAEIQAAVAKLRREIDAYEERHRHPQ